MLANFGWACATNRSDVWERRWAAFDLLSSAGWRSSVGAEQVRLLCGGREAAIEQKAAVFAAGGIPREKSIPLIAAEHECVELGRALSYLITLGKCIVERGGLSVATLNPADGGIRFEQNWPRPLGPYQNILERVLRDRQIDARRFARCAACEAFFYKPRQASQACGRKCENVLMSRRHYCREKERQQKVLELRGRGKLVPDIARELGVKVDKVRRYLKA